MNILVKSFVAWLPLGVAITGLCMLVAMTVQQNYRQGLNDPQIQMAEDAAAQLAASTPVNQIIPIGSAESTNIALSLAPWVGIYDESGKALASSGELNGQAPQPPAGVFADTRTGLSPLVGHHLTIGFPQNENRISWQPNPDVRQAIVVVYVPERKEFAVAGRNMREVEKRIGSLGFFILLAWIAIMGATLFATAFVRFVSL